MMFSNEIATLFINLAHHHLMHDSHHLLLEFWYCSAKNLDKNEARTRSRAMQVPGSGLSAAASSSSGRSGRGSGSVPSSPAILSTSASSAVHDAELDSFRFEIF